MEEELPLRTRWIDFKEYEWDPYVLPFYHQLHFHHGDWASEAE